MLRKFAAVVRFGFRRVPFSVVLGVVLVVLWVVLEQVEAVAKPPPGPLNPPPNLGRVENPTRAISVGSFN